MPLNAINYLLIIERDGKQVRSKPCQTISQASDLGKKWMKWEEGEVSVYKQKITYELIETIQPKERSL